MKLIIYLSLYCLSVMSSVCRAQESIVYITPDKLAENIKKNTDKATVIQFWVPNCANAAEIVNHYNELENDYAKAVDFYFIGITNRQELVSTLLKNNNFKHTIYIADPSVNNELGARKESFSLELCKLLKIKETDFITMYLDEKDKVIHYGDEIDVEKEKLKKTL